MIAAVSTVFNEADIVGKTFRHLLNSGVDRIYVADGMSTDGTRDILHDLGCVVVDDTDAFHQQPKWMNWLAGRAADDGAEWILPVDADEFWCPIGGSFPEALEETPDKLWCRMWQYIDMNYREPDPKPLPKMAFRWTPHSEISNGNHYVADRGPGLMMADIIEVREIQYRSFEHFVEKIEARNATIDPALPAGHGFHHKQYAGWSKDDLRPVWDAMQAKATVWDPIPCR